MNFSQIIFPKKKSKIQLLKRLLGELREMKHINAVAQSLQTTPEVISKVCQRLELRINKDNTLKPEIEQKLIQLKEVAVSQNMSLEEAVDYLLEMRNERSSNKRKFDKDK